MDVFSKGKRSEVMSKIRSKNTKAELLVFRELRRHKVYFQKHYKRVSGSPDIALPRKKKAVFIDGDFWHGYEFPKLKKRLGAGYWLSKIKANMERDKINAEELKKNGWEVLRVWEHDINSNFNETIGRIASFLQ